MGFLFVYLIPDPLVICERMHYIFYPKKDLDVITITQTKCPFKVMSKYIKKSYCKNCGASNDWINDEKTHLLEKPKFCGSCGCNLTTGKKPKQKKEVATEAKRKKPKPTISQDIPPLELDEEHCFFSNSNSQPLGKLVEPIEKEEPELDPKDG